MNNQQISNGIKRLAAMMKLLDENPFKIRAFEKAARIVERHPEEMGILIDEDRLKHLDGIGDTLARIILYYAKSGGPTEERELIARLPQGLPDLLELSGLGIKKVQILWQDLEITTVDLLHQACMLGKLSNVKGFGPKLEQKLLESMEFRKRHIQDYHLDLALSVAESWSRKLEALDCIHRIEVTGQLRRRNTLIQSVDFLMEASSTQVAEQLMGQFDLVPRSQNPIIFEDVSGLPIHLWASDSSEFGYHQLKLTAGETFQKKLEAIPARANTQAMSERELCQSLGIQWIEPELRDAFDEFPKDRNLVEPGDVKGVFHAHSTWSDGQNSLEEMVLEARNLGYNYLGISDHSQAAYYANGLKPDRVRNQWHDIDELNARYPDFHIFKGIEADILKDGRLDYDEELLRGFDFVIASIHSHFHLDPVTQTDRIIRALQCPFTTMLGHPTGRMLLAREGYNPDLNAIIEAASEYEKIIEINTTPKRLDLDWEYLIQARELGVKISINPDAHSVKGLKTIPLGVMMARKAGLTAADIVNTLNLKGMQNFLQARSNA